MSFLNKIKNKIKNKKNFRVISNSFSYPTTVILIRKFLEINIKKIFKKNINGLFHLRNDKIMSYYDLSMLIQKIILKGNKDKYVQKCSYLDYKTIAKRPTISKLGLKKTRKVFNIPNDMFKKEVKELLL